MMCWRLLQDGVSTIIVNNGDNPLNAPNGRSEVIWHRWEGEPVNLSKLWNLGLQRVAEAEGDNEYVVAVFNDDLELPKGVVQRLGDAITRHDAAGAFVSGALGREYVLSEAHAVPLHMRMAGFAFALRGSKKLLADESLMWWFGDDDLDWRIRKSGGNVGVPIDGLKHHDPNGYTSRHPELEEQAGRDRATFAAKWGMTPW